MSAAEAILNLSFPPSVLERMNYRAEKNRRGEADERELEELEHYSEVGNLINILQSNARRSLGE
jgi:hypothetical protein